jgi:membrane-associated protease RseP (regulator of RpoE activity)
MREVEDRGATSHSTDDVRRAASDVLAIEDVTEGIDPGNSVRVRGRLLLPADEAWQRLNDRLRPLGWTPWLRQRAEADGTELLAMPVTFGDRPTRVLLPAILFVLTVLSCLFTGAQMVEGLTEINLNLLDGVPFTAALLGILTAHEFGHYLVARRYGSPTSLPYFIPMPFPVGPFGTMGAVITAGAPIRNKRHLLAIGAAGPVAGLLVTIPVLLLGLHLSRLEPLPAGGYWIEGNSILYAALKYAVFGQLLPSGGMDVIIHPVAFAGWAGLLVTGLNLIPVGQLDGGHIAYALLGARRARTLGWVALVGLALLTFRWQGWLLWLGLLLLFGRVQDTLMDDITELTDRQRVFALGMLVVLVLVFVPIPITIVP